MTLTVSEALLVLWVFISRGIQKFMSVCFLIALQDICNSLWCRVGRACHSKMEPAADGTKCGDNKVKCCDHYSKRSLKNNRLILLSHTTKIIPSKLTMQVNNHRLNAINQGTAFTCLWQVRSLTRLLFWTTLSWTFTLDQLLALLGTNIFPKIQSEIVNRTSSQPKWKTPLSKICLCIAVLLNLQRT